MKSLGSFLKEVKIELSKVVWPRRDEFVGAVIVVLLTLSAFSVFLGIVNYVFKIGTLKGFQFLAFGR